jgi:DNA-damage-inducible protein J
VRIGLKNRGITIGTGEQIGEQVAKHHYKFLCKSVTCSIHSVDASPIHKGSDNLRALFLARNPRTTRGSGHRCCGWLPAETLEIGHFLGQSRLCSPFGLRVDVYGALAKSTTYACRFTVNQGRQSGIERRQSIASGYLTVSQLRYIIAETEDSIMAHSTMLHVRVDDEIKTQASEALAAMGLSVSDAVRILLKRVVNDQAFPLELKVPNAQTRAAMEEARAMAKARTARFESADALINDLENASFGASQKARQQ